MPHVIVKMYSGKSEEQKAAIAEAVARAVIDTAGSSEAAVSVAIEDVDPADWVERVYKPDITAKPETLYRKPGYDPT